MNFSFMKNRTLQKYKAFVIISASKTTRGNRHRMHIPRNPTNSKNKIKEPCQTTQTSKAKKLPQSRAILPHGRILSYKSDVY